jgi:DNA topoisomerase-1
MREALLEVAGQLRNTLAVCRKSYVHPRVLAVLQGEPSPDAEGLAPRQGLNADECRLLALLGELKPRSGRPRAAPRPRANHRNTPEAAAWGLPRA